MLLACSSSFTFLAESTTRAPANANSSARFKPSPREDPVMTTTLPAGLQSDFDLRKAELASAAVNRAPLVVSTAGVRYLVRRVAILYATSRRVPPSTLTATSGFFRSQLSPLLDGPVKSSPK